MMISLPLLALVGAQAGTPPPWVTAATETRLPFQSPVARLVHLTDEGTGCSLYDQPFRVDIHLQEEGGAPSYLGATKKPRTTGVVPRSSVITRSQALGNSLVVELQEALACPSGVGVFDMAVFMWDAASSRVWMDFCGSVLPLHLVTTAESLAAETFRAQGLSIMAAAARNGVVQRHQDGFKVYGCEVSQCQTERCDRPSAWCEIDSNPLFYARVYTERALVDIHKPLEPVVVPECLEEGWGGPPSGSLIHPYPPVE